MYKVKVFVTLKESVVDPQGSAATKALQKIEFPEVKDVRIGKFIELTVEKTEKNIEETVHEMCCNLLVNTVIEDYRFEIEEVGAQ
ncbi:phosphoribosylformylglycinamidine synthase subunit PurS [Lederbergia citrea]|uniref:Phosphoribosylformylglycinamidine synthase subunit PurS n=1 Tax=Lederbergia citrea TaxID=2833581 RepID=A0A942UQS0_9BACI|nr:phosphoribosylformylglycinamidine synthase subunit PurS [Lederbergia citrea]MBS4179476.1 phosphoribosylformylglycinamidine synthase subunit PurS [Lederbergia citrea]MBS4224407.1 phosphoribosylformylglycinamidine synthase subunit PurS [Lederbergia citrea]